jgi:hypothetical protein
MAIPKGFHAKELEQLGVANFRDFPLNGEMREGCTYRSLRGAVSADRGFKAIVVDSQVRETCFHILRHRLASRKVFDGRSLLPIGSSGLPDLVYRREC